jgi:glycosyltransferase involved in cell wall biosynthesis
LSVLNQTYLNVEYIVIDGGSKDGTVDILKKYADRISYLVSEPDKGIFDAMNKGIRFAKGQWINFMNAGDKYVDNEVLSRIWDIGNDYSKFAVVYGDAYNDFVDAKKYYVEKPFFERNDIIKPMGFCHQSVFVRLTAVPDGGFNTSFRLCSDYNMMQTIYKAGGKFKHVSVPVVIYDTKGVSKTRWKELLIEEARVNGMNNYFILQLIILKRNIVRLIKTAFKCLRKSI